MITNEQLQEKIAAKIAFKRAIRNQICPYCGGDLHILPNPYEDEFIDGACCGKIFYINEGVEAHD
jgi:hypothetical protein